MHARLSGQQASEAGLRHWGKCMRAAGGACGSPSSAAPQCSPELVAKRLQPKQSALQPSLGDESNIKQQQGPLTEKLPPPVGLLVPVGSPVASKVLPYQVLCGLEAGNHAGKPGFGARTAHTPPAQRRASKARCCAVPWSGIAAAAKCITGHRHVGHRRQHLLTGCQEPTKPWQGSCPAARAHAPPHHHPIPSPRSPSQMPYTAAQHADTPPPRDCPQETLRDPALAPSTHPAPCPPSPGLNLTARLKSGTLSIS